MNNTTLREKIENGSLAIFEVKTDDKFDRYEILNELQLRDLLVMGNGERLLKLAKLYNFGNVMINDEIYSLLCGKLLISYMLTAVVEDITDDIIFSKYIDEENFELFKRRRA